MVRRAHVPLIVELLVSEDGLDGPTGAAVDVLRLVNHLAQTRGAKRPVCTWRWTTPDGRPLRRGGAPPRSPGVARIVVVGGWLARNGPHLDRLVRRDRCACARLRAVHAAGGHVIALYTAVALAGEAGLLQGRRAVVPWPFVQSVLRHAPQAQLVETEAWIEADRVWTAASPALASELTLRALQACGLQDLVDAARSVLLHAPQRQRLVRAIAQGVGTRVGPGSLERARRWLEDHLHEPYSLAATARAANTSARSLLRHFRATFDRTPLEMLHELRVTHARMLLETTYLPLETVAERCGWRDPAMLRRVFRRATGTTPARYRERHRLRTERRQWGRDLDRADRDGSGH
ncbi:MAG: GlxA family transcriptional regulator [Lautropia sp.]